MKLSEQWLREWVASDTPLEALAEQLTMAGLEVDAIEAAAPALNGVRVGHILACAPHPEADRLQVCEVDVGNTQTLSIVCGAPNAAPGVRAPVAMVGSVLPNGTAIEASEIRGQRSHGMLCSASELALGDAADGIWLLAGDAAAGQGLGEYLGLSDSVLDIDLTPNRGDCLSVRGVAREVAVAEHLSLREPQIPEPAATTDMVRTVCIDAPERCVGYGARCIVAVAADAATPTWMTERLRRSGVRHINLPVDIGNYVMLAFGQPMHAFDGDKLVGEIHVRQAIAGETLVTLDGESVTFDADTLVIADGIGPVAVAGMIGGQRTAVDSHTTHVVFEAACFTPSAVAGSGRRYKIHTESLHRFERGVDPDLYPRALSCATGLLLDFGGGHAGPPVVEHGQPLWPAGRRIDLHAAHIERLLGQAVDGEWLESALARLGLIVERKTPGTWSAQPPNWRFDLSIEADLIEELARLYGYDRIESRNNGTVMPPVSAASDNAIEHVLENRLRERGYSEAITYSFVAPELHTRLIGDASVIALDNPIAEPLSEMRRTLWAGLLPAWHHNVRRQQERVRLFERGLRFLPDASAAHGIGQVMAIAGVVGGRAAERHWDQPSRAVDFFDVKGDVEALLMVTKMPTRFERESHPGLHPGRCARIYVGERAVGWLGQLAPVFKESFKNIEMPYVFELDYKEIPMPAGLRVEPISEQPSIRRDLAVVVGEDIPVAALVDAVYSVKSTALQALEVFDVFRGHGLENGFKSVALGLIFQDKASTLTDRGVEKVVARIVDALRVQCDAHIRGDSSGID